MRSILSTAMLAAILATNAVAQVAIDGPATAAVGERVTLDVVGLPTFDLSKPIGESLKWVDDLRFATSSPGGAPIKFDSLIGIDFVQKQWRLTLSFKAAAPGAWFVSATDGKSIVAHRLEVGPTDPPEPRPPVVVVPGKSTIAYVRETKTQDPSTAALVLSIRARFPTMLVRDPDLTDLEDPTQPLPQLVAIGEDGKVFYRESAVGKKLVDVEAFVAKYSPPKKP